MSEEKNRKRNLSTGDESCSNKRRSICLEEENSTHPSNIVSVNGEQANVEEEPSVNSNHVSNDSCTNSCDKHTDETEKRNGIDSQGNTKSESDKKPLPSVTDSVFNDRSTLRSVSESDVNDSDDDPLDEYETQYFGFTPKSFMNGVYNALAEYSRESLAAFTQYIDIKYPNQMSASKLQEGRENMMKYVLKKLNRSIDVLEQYLMTNVFKIPDHIILPEDHVQADNQYTQEDEKQLDSEIKQLEDKILTIRYANGVLRQDLGKMDEVQALFEKSLEQMEALETMTKDSGVSDVKNDTIEAIHKVTRMIELVQNLENMKMKTSL